jgi:excisionase family DNA binding protein
VQDIKIFETYPDVVGVEELQKMLNVGIVLAYRLLKERKIKSRKIGREYKISKTAVIKYLLEGTEE